MGEQLGRMQADNLLGLLNEMRTPAEFASALGMVDDSAALELGDALLARRSEIGAFLNMKDASAIVDWQGEVGAALRASSTSPFFVPRSHSRAGARLPLGFGELAPFLMPGHVLLDIEWHPIPDDWNPRALQQFLIALAGKRLDLSVRLDKAERSVRAREDILDALRNQTPPAGADTIEAAEASLDAALDDVLEITREIEEINRHVKNGDAAAVWAIVRRNLQRELKALRRELAGVEAEDPVDEERKKQLELEIVEAEQRIREIEDEIHGE